MYKIMWKIISVKRNRIIISVVLFATIVFSAILFISQCIWSNALIDAILDDNEHEVSLLLKDKTKNPNFVGMDVAGLNRPLNRACLDSHWDSGIITDLVNGGAKIYQEDYYALTSDVCKDNYEALSFFVKSKYKPEISDRKLYENLLENLATIDMDWRKNMTDLSRDEWESLITKFYKTIYMNAKPFDKKRELKKDLKYSKQCNNHHLHKFIKGELAQLY